MSVNNFISMIENKMFLHKHNMKNQNVGAAYIYNHCAKKLGAVIQNSRRFTVDIQYM